MSKEKTKNTSVLSRARIRHSKAGRIYDNEHFEFKGKVVKSPNRTQVYFGDPDRDLEKTG